MNRNRSLRGRNNDELMPYREGGDNDLMAPFENIHRQIMRGFGGLDDDFFGGMMRMDRDPFQEVMEFSGLHNKLHSKKNEGTFICQTFVQSSKMGPDGKMISEKYFDSNLGQHRGGNTISERQQAYKNSAGVNRLAQERMLNDKGRKIVKENRGNDFEQTNHYYNIDEEEAAEFDRNWENINKDTKFTEQYRKYLGYGGGQRNMLDFDRPFENQKRLLAEKPRAIQPEFRPSSKHASDTRSQMSHLSQASRKSKLTSGSRKAYN